MSTKRGEKTPIAFAYRSPPFSSLDSPEIPAPIARRVDDGSTLGISSVSHTRSATLADRLPALFGRFCAQVLLDQRWRAPRTVTAWVCPVCWSYLQAQTCVSSQLLRVMKYAYSPRIFRVFTRILRVFCTYCTRTIRVFCTYITRTVHVDYE